MNRDVLLQFVGTLDCELRNIFIAADDYVKAARDTLSPDFQIACRIVDAFDRQAAQLMPGVRHHWQCSVCKRTVCTHEDGEAVGPCTE